MATIAKVSNAASATFALGYGLGEKTPLHHDTKSWLADHDLAQPAELENCRAVVVGGTNGIDPLIANEQFRAVRQLFHQTQKRNQVLRITQSFADNELDPLNHLDWQKANDLGVQLAKKLYPDYQSAVYTHLDGANHHLHNHIIVNKVSLTTGKKLDEKRGQTISRVRTTNDELARAQGWHILTPVREHQSQTEQDLTQAQKYSYMADLRHRIDGVMQDPTVSSYEAFSARLSSNGVNVALRGQNISYAFLDANQKQRRARGARLGTDYDKEALLNELARREQQTQKQTEISNDQRPLTADREIEQRKPALESRKPGLDRLAVATGRAQRNQSDTKHRFDRFRKAVRPLTNGLQHFKDGLRAFTKRARELLDLRASRLNFAQKFQADLARKKQAQQQQLQHDLSQRTRQTPSPRQNNKPGRGPHR